MQDLKETETQARLRWIDNINEVLNWQWKEQKWTKLSGHSYPSPPNRCVRGWWLRLSLLFL